MTLNSQALTAAFLLALMETGFSPRNLLHHATRATQMSFSLSRYSSYYYLFAFSVKKELLSVSLPQLSAKKLLNLKIIIKAFESIVKQTNCYVLATAPYQYWVGGSSRSRSLQETKAPGTPSINFQQLWIESHKISLQCLIFSWRKAEWS